MIPFMPMRAAFALVLASLSSANALAFEPLTLGGARLSLGAELSATLAPRDRAFFNYNDYEHSLRRVRLSVSAQIRAGEHVALLGEVLSENADTPRAYALYLRLRPWKARRLDLQAGIIPPVFGAFARRGYGADNPLIGYPLAYQYLTTLRSNAATTNADELLLRRGQGWRVGYPIGDPSPAPGLPLVNALRWDTGVQARWSVGPVDLSAAVTQGTLSHPRVKDDNDGKQLSARVGARPVTGLVVGASAARGAYLGRDLIAQLPPAARRDYKQRAWGVDVEYARGHAILRGEAIWSEWDVPLEAPGGFGASLRASSVMGEGRYKLAPGLYVAARVDHLGFSRIQGAAAASAWDAPVTRMEAGVGYSLWRNVVLKAAFQRNRRTSALGPRHDLAAVQVVAWY